MGLSEFTLQKIIQTSITTEPSIYDTESWEEEYHRIRNELETVLFDKDHNKDETVKAILDDIFCS